MAVKIGGYIPDTDTYLLVDADLPLGSPPPVDTPARLLNADRGILYPPVPFHSLVARCPYFQEPTENEIPGVESVLAEVKEVRGPPADTIGELAIVPPSFRSDGGAERDTNPTIVSLQQEDQVDWLRESRQHRDSN
jgi:hypothetical protein